MDEPVDAPRPIPRIRDQIEIAEFARRLHEATPRTWVTTTLVTLNVGVFLAMVASGVSVFEPETGDLLSFGADHGPLTTSGQWWRLVSSTFVHGGLIHLGVNMWALWQGGRLAERFFGNGAFLFLYLASGIGASVTSVLWSPTSVSVGASGSIFGVFGGLLAVLLLQRGEIPVALLRDLRKSTITVVAINVILGFTVPVIDNAAHLGGLATGFVLGLCLRRPLPTPRAEVDSSRRFLRVLPVLVLVAAGAAAAKLRVDRSPEVRSMRQFTLALSAFEAGEPERAMREIEASLASHPEDPAILTLSGDVRWSMGDRDGAARDYVRAIGLAPTYPYPRKRLAWTHQDAGDLETAISYFNDAIRLDRADPEPLTGRGWVRMQQGKLLEALADFDAALELAPDVPMALTLRPCALYDLQRWSEALLGFRWLIEVRVTEDKLPDLYVWAIRARTGEREAAATELKARFADAAPGDGRARIAAFVLGETAQPDLIAQAAENGERSPNGQPIGLCEAWYFVGMKDLVEGRSELALGDFRKCVETNAIDTPAWSSAVAEIAALER